LLRILDNKEVYRHNNVSYVSNSSLSESDSKELLFWSTDPLESPSGDLFTNIVRKSNFITVYEQLMPTLGLTGKETVLELGGGHCWASALIKRNYPECYIVASDLSPEAVEFVEKYEIFLGTKVDEKWAFNCRRIPFDDAQFDVIFAFAAFHHFGEERDFSEALREIVRVLRPRGRILLLYEPSSPKWLYRLALERVNRKRASFSHDVDENILILSNMERICEELGCKFRAQYFTSYEQREGIVETIYYYALTRLKPLQRLLPCTVNMTIEKL
jgi:SAM-dependent methyltransferase